MKSLKDRLFIGVFPCAIVYADRAVEVDRDYKRVASLPYRELALQVADPKSPLLPLIRKHAKTIIARRGKRFSIDGCGKAITLGS